LNSTLNNNEKFAFWRRRHVILCRDTYDDVFIFVSVSSSASINFLSRQTTSGNKWSLVRSDRLRQSILERCWTRTKTIRLSVHIDNVDTMVYINVFRCSIPWRHFSRLRTCFSPRPTYFPNWIWRCRCCLISEWYIRPFEMYISMCVNRVMSRSVIVEEYSYCFAITNVAQFARKCNHRRSTRCRVSLASLVSRSVHRFDGSFVDLFSAGDLPLLEASQDKKKSIVHSITDRRGNRIRLTLIRISLSRFSTGIGRNRGGMLRERERERERGFTIVRCIVRSSITYNNH